MERFSDLCRKDVINICDGQCLGQVSDLALDWCKGGLFRRREEMCIPLECITRVGRDIVLVELRHMQGYIIQD